MVDQQLNSPSANIALIGYRGSGKTTVGRLLAERLGWAFLDTDALIEADAGVSIAEMFASQGESAFRTWETEAIFRVTQGKRQVISVGGGAVLSRENVERLRSCCTLIWLTAPSEVLWRRISGDPGSPATRPNLTEDGGIDEVRRMLAQRQRAYREATHWTVSTQSRTPAQVADAIGVLIEDAG